jgi:hypothetical protein
VLRVVGGNERLLLLQRRGRADQRGPARGCSAERVIRAGSYFLDELTLLEASEDPSTDLAQCRQKHATRVDVDSCCHG